MKSAAIFDLDGTILNVSSERTFFLYLLLRGGINPSDLLKWAGHFIETTYRADYVKATKANKMYLCKKPCAKIYELAESCFNEKLINRISKRMVAEIEQHRREGRYLILLSGTLDFLLEHFAKYLNMDQMIGTKAEIYAGAFTGWVDGIHPFGPAKADIVRQMADRYGIDLNRSYGYANSFSDVPFLNAVGYAVAVNPDRRLTKYARQHNWKVIREV